MAQSDPHPSQNPSIPIRVVATAGISTLKFNINNYTIYILSL